MRRFLCSALLLLFFTTLAAPVLADDDTEQPQPWRAGTFSGLSFRGIGPGLTSGRIGDFAVDPRNPYHFYVAVCSGGVWETKDAGTSWQPIFDDEGSYSIGCVTIDPTDPNVVWVGTGENNSQRSVAYGDGVYKSVDGGASWQNMGLRRSLHVGKIVVHPADGNVVFVAAMGPLWGPGGDRGLYKTTDGGASWELSLEIDENTGVVDVVMDPRDPDVLYAAAYQRRRHTWTLIDGGPGSGIYKSTDGGASWDQLSKGLPGGDMGRIGLAISLPRPDTVYAIIEAVGDAGGFFRTTDAGTTWQKMSGYVSGSPQYYQEIIADPVEPDRVYSLDTFLQVTNDGGRTFERVGVEFKHVDDHAMWIDPHNNQHFWVGCDGGIYETFDAGAHWRFSANLPVTQFYRVAVDYDEPFYNVYGGTQDNNTQGVPSRTINRNGIANRDAWLLLGGDGFEPAVDPVNPNIIYCQWQYGNLNRYDRASGEILDIQPQPELGETLKWNWDAPVLISPHNHQRLYYACQKVFRSDDMGNSWTRISDDLTRGLDRNRLEVMDRVWGIDTVAKNRSTSFYGNIVALAESPLVADLLYAGTDDGLIQVTSDGGTTWTRYDSFDKVPEGAYVAGITPSRHDAGTVFACFDNHKQDDFQPYVLKSTDHGKSWRSIAADLPERGNVYSLAQDHVDPDLLFVGTEFGVFFTTDGGEGWLQLDAGIPVIACRDLEIQRRENDLVVATFGRGFYILDDYTPLRGLQADDLEQPAILFPVQDALLYVEARPIGGREKGAQGHGFYTAKNPPFGAVLTYYLKDSPQTLEQMRQKTEKDKVAAEEPVYYPTWDELRAEEREDTPILIFTITDNEGRVVRRVTGPTGSGLHRIAWNLRHGSLDPVDGAAGSPSAPWDTAPSGPLVAPGTYTASMAMRVRGEETTLGEAQSFAVEPLGLCTTQTDDFDDTVAFRRQAAELQRAVQGASRIADDTANRLVNIKQAILNTAAVEPELLTELMMKAGDLENRLRDLLVILAGDRTVSSRSEPTTPSLRGRIGRVLWGGNSSTSAPTATQRRSYELAATQFDPLLAELKTLVEVDIRRLEDRLEQIGAPYTPGRMPRWNQ